MKNILSALLCAFLLSSNATSALAQTCQFGVGQCRPGYVWREARHDDHVCVTGASRLRAQQDAGEQLKRVVPGSDSCIHGFVWREATADDHICVTGTTRKESAEENRLAASRVDPNCTATAMCTNDCKSEKTSCLAAQDPHRNCGREYSACIRACKPRP